MSDTSLFSPEDQALIDANLALRKRIIRKMTEKGKLPTSDEDRKFLLDAVNGIDSSIFTRARIKSQDQANQTNTKITEIIGQLLYSAKTNAALIPLRESLPDLQPDYRVLDLAPGEDAPGIQPLSFDEFYKNA